jgi:ribose transport system permease protein
VKSAWRKLGLARDDLVVGSVAYVALLALVVALSILQPGSLEYDQVTILVAQGLVVALLAAGQTLVLLTGGIDLSVGGALSVINTLVAQLMVSDGRILSVSVAVLAAGCAIGLINGFLVAYARLQPFVATLGTWFVFSGLALVIMSSPGGTIAPGLAWLTSGTIVGYDNSIVMLVLLAVVGGVFLRTRLGLSIRAIGSDRQAAVNAGIPERRVLMAAYALSGLMTAIAGIVLSAQNMAGDPSIGNTYLLPTVTAAVIGGAALTGGRGGVAGSIVGALVLTYVASVTFAAGLPAQWSLIFTSAVLAISVALQHVLRRVFVGRHEVTA